MRMERKTMMMLRGAEGVRWERSEKRHEVERSRRNVAVAKESEKKSSRVEWLH